MVSLTKLYNIKESRFTEDLKDSGDPARGDKGKNREKEFYFVDEPEDPETGAVKSKVVYKRSISNMVKDLEAELQDFRELVKDKPDWPDAETMELRIDLIEEELEELKDAILSADGTLIDVADALTDLLYVVYGAGHSFGINLDKCFEEVHNSNMSKLGNDGKPIYREDGKILKGENFREPNLKEVLNKQ